MEIQKFQFLSLAICTSILVVKYIITLSIQGSKRFDAGSRPPEDSKFDRGKQTFGMDLESTVQQKEADQRWQRIVQNDLESIPLTLIIFVLGLFAGNQILASICYFVYTVARVLHTVAFANRMQPYRSIFWIVGVLVLVAEMLNILIGAAINM